MRLAAFDYGTVTSRFLVADVDHKGISEVCKDTAITHLGEGVDARGHLSGAAIERVIAASRRFLDQAAALPDAAQKPIQACQAIATSATRDADNGAEFIHALAALGIPLQTVSGTREAELSFRGTLSGFPAQTMGEDTVLVCDIGGGSTELISGCVVSADSDSDSALETVKISLAVSLNVGARRLSDRFLHSDPPGRAELLQAHTFTHDLLATWYAQLSRKNALPTRIFAVAGTATSLVSMREKMTVYDPKRVHGAAVSRGEVAAVLQKIESMPLQERCRIIGLEAGRASVIIGGLVVLNELLELTQIEQITVSESDILQGIILDLFAQRLAHSFKQASADENASDAKHC